MRKLAKLPGTWFRSYVLSLLIKANAPYNEVTAEEDQTMDCLVYIKWDFHNNLNIRYSGFTDHVDEDFLKGLLDEDFEHYLEHLRNIGVMKQGGNEV